MFLVGAIRCANARRPPSPRAEGSLRARFILGRSRCPLLHAVRDLSADRGARARGRGDARGAQSARRAADGLGTSPRGSLRRDPRAALGGRGRARGDRRPAGRTPAPGLLRDGRRDARAPGHRPLQRGPSRRRGLAGRGRARGGIAAGEVRRARYRAGLQLPDRVRLALRRPDGWPRQRAPVRRRDVGCVAPRASVRRARDDQAGRALGRALDPVRGGEQLRHAPVDGLPASRLHAPRAVRDQRLQRRAGTRGGGGGRRARCPSWPSPTCARTS